MYEDREWLEAVLADMERLTGHAPAAREYPTIGHTAALHWSNRKGHSTQRSGTISGSTMALAKEVGRYIRALRQQRGLTQAALAELIDRSEVAVRSIERGASAPSFETLERLTVALDVPAAGLFPCDNRSSTTERHARDLASLSALGRGLGEADLDMALDILRTIVKHHGPGC